MRRGEAACRSTPVPAVTSCEQDRWRSMKRRLPSPYYIAALPPLRGSDGDGIPDEVETQLGRCRLRRAAVTLH